MWKSLTLAIVIAAVAAATGLVLDGAGAYSGASEALSAWLARSGLVSEGAVSVPALAPLATVLASLFSAWVVTEAARVRDKVWVPLAMAGLIATSVPVLALLGVLFSPFAALVSCGVVGALGLALAFSQAGKLARRATVLLGHRASPQTLVSSSGSGSAVAGPVKREVSVVTVRLLAVGDLVGALDPRAFVEIQSEVAATVLPILKAAGAVVDDAAPDCLQGTFGAFGEASDSHADAAIKAALQVNVSVRTLAKRLSEEHREEVRVGIAVESGAVVLGAYPGASPGVERFGTAGSPIDFGRRLAGANAIYGSRLLAGTRVHQLAGDSVSVRPLEMLADPVAGGLAEVYEVLAPAGELSDEAEDRREMFWKAVVLYREGKWRDSLAHFERARSGEITDSPLEYFIGLARRAYAGESFGGAPDENAGRREKPHHARDAQTL